MKKTKLKTIVETPAQILEAAYKVLKYGGKTFQKIPAVQNAENFWKKLGPGLTTGAADDDPSGIATYSQTGSRFGFSMLWLSAFTFPLMAVVQEMCARIGLVTGVGLAANIKKYFPKWALYTSTILLFVANTFNIGADLGAMAEATKLIFPSFNFYVLVILFAGLSLVLQIFINYGSYARYLKWVSLILLTYIFSALSINLNWGEILKNAILPTINFNKNEIFMVCAILGTTISPYLFFWQTSQEVEEEILEGKTTIQERKNQTSLNEIKTMRTDVWSGMFFSNLVMFFIIVTCGHVLFKQGLTNIQTAAEAAEALRPLAGNYAYLLFTIGIIGTGLLAVPVLAGSCSYAISETFGWKEGLYRKFKNALAFYGVIIISVVLGICLNFTNISSINALLYSAVLNGLIAPIIIIFIVKISDNEKIMGKWANRPLVSGVGWLVVILMIIVATATLASFMF